MKAVKYCFFKLDAKFSRLNKQLINRYFKLETNLKLVKYSFLLARKDFFNCE